MDQYLIRERFHLLQDMINIMRFTLFRFFPKTTLRIEYKRLTGYKLNINNPRSYNEKLQWLKLNWYDPEATRCADKYLVREFVKERGLGHLLNDLYGVFENIDDINLDKLPNEFVIKVTHGCGQNIICKDKSKLNWDLEKKKLKKWLKENHYYKSLEWVYRDIKPRIIIEKLIQTADGKPPKDYKIFCFNGEPKFLFVASDRGIATKFDFYDCDWNLLDVKQHYPNSGKVLPKPNKLEEVLNYSRILSKGFPHVRIDFYIENDVIIFGECTFFHFSGTQKFEPNEFDYKIGEYLDLTNMNLKNLGD